MSETILPGHWKPPLPPKYVYKVSEPSPWSLEVKKCLYQKIFGNNIQEWKEALDQIEIGIQCRGFNKSESGILCTFHLLCGKIFSEDNHIGIIHKYHYLNDAISRFLSAAVRGSNPDELSATSMSAIAKELKIDPRIVALRHASCHSNNPCCNLFDLRAAIDVGMSWVKRHYWEKEVIIEEKIPILPQKKVVEFIEEKTNKSDDIQTFDMSEIRVQELEDKLKFYFEMFEKDNVSIDAKGSRSALIIKWFVENYKLYPDQLMESFVRNIFFRFPIYEETEEKPCSHCKSVLPLKLVKKVSLLVERLSHFNIKPNRHMIYTIIEIGSDHDFTASQWLQLIFGNIIDPKHCNGHRLYKKNKLTSKLKWKDVITELLKYRFKWRKEITLYLLDKCQKTEALPKDFMEKTKKRLLK